MGILTSVAIIPQIHKVYAEEDASTQSLITWNFFLLYAVMFFIYGVVHREKPIITIYFLQIVTLLIMVIGIIKYN